MVRLRRTRHEHIVASFNGLPLGSESVSINIARRYLELDGGSWRADISHESRFTPGRGYGTSGAGALGLSFALNDALELYFSNPEAAQIAHLCEVECKTGLGTVTSVFSGGLAVRTSPGAPEIGEVRRLGLNPSLRIVSASFGPIQTQRVLANLELKKTINKCGQTLVGKLLRDHSASGFIEISRKFSNCVGLISSRLRRVMNALDSSGFSASMAMLGESVFCLAPREDAWAAEKILRRNELQPITSKVARTGAHLI